LLDIASANARSAYFRDMQKRAFGKIGPKGVR
jgi:hypothetical protein